MIHENEKQFLFIYGMRIQVCANSQSKLARFARVRFLRYSYATLNRFLNPTGGGLYLYLEIALKY